MAGVDRRGFIGTLAASSAALLAALPMDAVALPRFVPVVLASGIDARCSFCNRSRRETSVMLAGPGGVRVCGDCVALVRELLQGKYPEERAPRPKAPLSPWRSERRAPTAAELTRFQSELAEFAAAQGVDAEYVARIQSQEFLHDLALREDPAALAAEFAKRDGEKNRVNPAAIVECSFCGAPQSLVKQLVAGPTVYICDRCTEACADVIAALGP